MELYWPESESDYTTHVVVITALPCRPREIRYRLQTTISAATVAKVADTAYRYYWSRVYLERVNHLGGRYTADFKRWSPGERRSPPPPPAWIRLDPPLAINKKQTNIMLSNTELIVLQHYDRRYSLRENSTIRMLC